MARRTGSETRSVLRTLVLCGVSSIALAAAGATFAQTANGDSAAAKQDDSTVVVVTGIRGSLQRAMNIKKGADGVVDGISAEDLGKYPDTNLADSFQRIPGVSINRVNDEGEQVTVRGFGPGYNSVTVDGRTMPATSIPLIGSGQGGEFSAGNTRAFDFSNLASDGVQTVEVYKTGRADVEPGGIGASINVQTLQPLAHPGMQASLTVKGLANSDPGLGLVLKKRSVTPEISGAYQWTDDAANFGVAAFGSYSEKSGSSREVTVNDWTIEPFSTFNSPSYVLNTVNAPSNPNQLIAKPQDARYHYAENHVQRTNGEVVAQWRPNDQWTVTANELYAQAKEQEARAGYDNWFAASPFQSVTFDGNSTIDSMVSVTDQIPAGGKDQSYEAQLRAETTDINSTGLNVKFTPNEQWTFAADLSSSSSKSSPANPNGTSSTTQASADYFVGSNTTTYSPLGIPQAHPTLNFALAPAGGTTLTLADLSSQVGREFWTSQSDKITEGRFDFTYHVDSDSKLSGGIDYRKNINVQQSTSATDNMGNWGSTNPGDILQVAPGAVKTYCLACQFKTASLDPEMDTAYAFNAVDVFGALAPYYASPSFKPVNNSKYNQSAQGSQITYGSANYNKIQEAVSSAYVQFAMNSNFLSKPVKILGGLRYELTDVTVTALQLIPTGMDWQEKNNFQVVFGSSTPSPYTLKSHYSNLLPSLDLAMDITDDIKGRLSFSKTMARPEYDQMYATTSVNTLNNPSFLGAVATATAGNPALKPLTSDNLDLSVEWYYGKNSYVSLGYYSKAVNNFVGTASTNTPLFGLHDASTGASGTRSGAAVAALNSIAATNTNASSVNPNNMFIMTALIDQFEQKGQTQAQASTSAVNAFNSLKDASGNSYADYGTYEAAIFSLYDVFGNSTDPLQTFSLQQPVNNHTANINGFEFQIQHFFGDTGFGIAASATTVNGDVKLDNGAQPGVSQFALVGLSNTYNVTAIYEKHGISARLVYNWRDKYLDATNVDSSDSGEYTAAFGQLDGSISYNLTPRATLSFEALNLNKAHVVQYLRVPTDISFYQELDSRYEFGLRYKF